MVMMTAL